MILPNWLETGLGRMQAPGEQKRRKGYIPYITFLLAHIWARRKVNPADLPENNLRKSIVGSRKALVVLQFGIE